MRFLSSTLLQKHGTRSLLSVAKTKNKKKKQRHNDLSQQTEHGNVSPRQENEDYETTAAVNKTSKGSHGSVERFHDRKNRHNNNFQQIEHGSVSQRQEKEDNEATAAVNKASKGSHGSVENLHDRKNRRLKRYAARDDERGALKRQRTRDAKYPTVKRHGASDQRRDAKTFTDKRHGASDEKQIHASKVAASAPSHIHADNIKKLDAETFQYFAEISSLLGAGGSVTDPEERATLCVNALEETYGKELQLACDKSCSRVLEMLLSTCDSSQIASFLHRASPVFVPMANDACGSHVAETLLKSAAGASYGCDGDAPWCRTLKQALAAICQVVGARASDIISNRYGSHVVRSLLSLLSGAAFESSSVKPYGKISGGLLGRLLCSSNADNNPKHSIMFPDLLKSLIEKLLEEAKRDLSQLRKDTFAGPVLQMILQILAHDATAVAKAVNILLERNIQNTEKVGESLGDFSPELLKDLMFDNNSSHLVEAMLEVAPDNVYENMFRRIMSLNILELAVHRSANYVVQALITSVRCQDQVNLLVTELSPNFCVLIKESRSGVITSLLTVCRKFSIHQQEVCRALARAIHSESVSHASLVPRLLFLETYAKSKGVEGWKPRFGSKMSVLGCAMLQLVFSFPEECNQQFWLSLVSMEPTDMLATVKDPGGCHVVESFLSSDAPLKHRNKVITKLKGHFPELSMHVSSAFTLEKCFSVASIDLKEAICSELSTVQTELSKTKHGPHLLRKLEVELYSRTPQQWHVKMSTKQGTLKAFSELFNSKKTTKSDKK